MSSAAPAPRRAVVLPHLGNRHDRPSRGFEPRPGLEERRPEDEMVAPGEVRCVVASFVTLPRL